ncbi:MAG TPA: RIP metalloprotease RseP [Chromatiales bacterium]|nr:RIP metalloprotease RseP [Chromatiales bacterium]
MSSVLSSIFFFIIALGLLITVHEFGHFWVARKMGVKVIRFSVGFGKPLFSWRRANDETEYVVAMLPLGGYVQMLDEREGDVDPAELDRTFNRKSLGKRTAIVAAGPIFNFILAIAIYWLILVIGVSGVKPIVGEVNEGSIAAAGGFQYGDVITQVGDTRTVTWGTAGMALLDHSLDAEVVKVRVLEDGVISKTRLLDFSTPGLELERKNLLESIGINIMRPKIPALIGQVTPGGAAEQAGILAGDLLLSVDGQPVEDWETWVHTVRENPEVNLQVELERAGRVITVELRPARLETKAGVIGRIGATVAYPEALFEQFNAVERYSFFAALPAALVKTWEMSLLTLRMLGNMVIGNVSVENLSGPISIAQYAGSSAGIGFVAFAGFLALISISLGVLNLLPIPMLDGGHLFYYLIEWIKGSEVSEEVQMVGQQVGIVLLVLVMIVAFYNDIERLVG